jgi:hypothetical protein
MQGLSNEGADEAGAIMEAGDRSGLHPIQRWLLKIRGFILIPFILLSLFMKMQQFLFVSAVLGPVLALTWRTRRYLADASAVRLTRNPDGVLSGLLRLARQGGMVPGAQWAAHLFVVGPEAAVGQSEARLQRDMATVRQQSAGKAVMGQIAASWGPAQGAVLRYASELNAQEKGTLGATNSVMASFHPPLQERLKRLVAMGATAGSGSGREQSGWLARSGGMFLFAPLLALCGVLMAVALGLVFMLALFADLIVVTVGLLIALSLLGVNF